MSNEINIRDPDVVAREFNETVRNLIKRLEKKSRSDIEIANLDRLKKRITLLKSTMGDLALIGESSPFFIEYADKIISREETFFLTMDIRAEYVKRKNGKVDKQDEFMFSLTDSIREHYKKSSQKDRDDVYNDVKMLFNACVEYQIATN